MKFTAKRAIRFLLDFSPLEEALETAKKQSCCIVTPEMMIVELRLTPRHVARIEKLYGIRLHWFVPAYRAMRRHGLLKHRTRSWEKWLAMYGRKRRATALARPAFSFAEAEESQRQAFAALSPAQRAKVKQELSDQGRSLATAKRVLKHGKP